MGKSSGSTVTGIRVRLLEQLTIPVPPHDLQKQFADFVTQVDKSKVMMQAALEKEQVLFEKLAPLIMSLYLRRTFDLMFHSKGYSFQFQSVILNIPIRDFDLYGSYVVGAFGIAANIADSIIFMSFADFQKYVLLAASTQ